MSDLENKQKSKSTWGGGRPKGSKNKLVITDFFTPEDIDQAVAEAKLLAFGDGNTKPDRQVLIFVLEQLFGKATQRNEHTGAEGEPLVLQLAESIIEKYDTQSETERDSQG